MDDLEAFVKRAEGALSEEDHQTLTHLVESYIYVLELVGNKQTTINRLRKILFGAKTEKTRHVASDAEGKGEGSGLRAQENPADADVSGNGDGSSKPSHGHGRNGVEAYHGAEKIEVSHATLKAGDACPCCQKGKVREQAKPRVVVRLRGQAPVQGKVYELQRLRCQRCGEMFTAEAPQGIGSEKYDATTASIIAVLRYGSGLPWNRLEKLQEGVGIPLPASTQWDVISEAVGYVEPAYAQLVQEAAQGEILHNDDTPMKILELMGERAKQEECAEKPGERTGVFTSGIVSTCQGRRMALFFTGHQHAGENLHDVLLRRASERGPPIQMCDALSRNMPKELKVIVANCLAHGRRKFVELYETFPEPCLYVIEQLKEVYKVDALAKKQSLSPAERLALHQRESRPQMDDLHVWLTKQIEGKQVEPNSSLGEAIGYMLKHWQKLTLFLRQAGAPLDNNICERALKKSILHRKNSLFYKTRRGAYVGDIFMSLIHTCQLCDADPFDYLTELQRHHEQVTSNPGAWMPWNYPGRRRQCTDPSLAASS
ncbi:MAG: IS66 family transposase [Pseudomonadales bacterium]|nr:IS66 family transposase [Pseudomonadales bacterium]